MLKVDKIAGHAVRKILSLLLEHAQLGVAAWLRLNVYQVSCCTQAPRGHAFEGPHCCRMSMHQLPFAESCTLSKQGAYKVTKTRGVHCFCHEHIPVVAVQHVCMQLLVEKQIL